MNNPIHDFYQNTFKNISTSFVDKGIVYEMPNLSYFQCAELAKNAIIQKLISIAIGSVNQNGWDVKCSVFESDKKNEKLARQHYQILEELDFEKIIRQIVPMEFVYGHCFSLVSDGLPKIYTPDFFNIYWNKYRQNYHKITMNVDGQENNSLAFTEGEDIFHFKHYNEEYKGLPSSPLESCYNWLVFYAIAIEVNSNMVGRGNIGIVLPIFEKEMGELLEEDTKTDENGRFLKVKEILLKKWQEITGGFANSHKTSMILSGVKEIVELGKDNQKMQLKELIDYAESKFYDAFGIERTSENSNRASAQTLTYQLQDNIAKAIESQIDRYVNNFLWKNCIMPKMAEKYGVVYENSEKLYFEFNKPNDPDEIAKMTFFSNIFVQSATAGKPVMTLTEIRDKMGLPEPTQELIDLWEIPKLLESKTEPKNKLNFSEEFELKKKDTPTELALKSKDYNSLKYDEKNKTKIPKGFLPSWEKAISKQLTEFVKNWEKEQSSKLPKIETFYSFNALTKDLLNWIDFGIENAKSENKQNNLNFSEKFESLNYSQEILDWVDSRVENLVKGGNLFKSVDEATSLQIFELIKKGNETQKSIKEIAENLINSIPQISKSRASLIAEMETASAVEFGRFDYFKNEDFDQKKQLSIGDGRDTIWSKKAAALDWVDIDFKYDTQFGTKSKTLPLNYRERGTLIFRKKE